MSSAELPRNVDTAHALEQLVGMSLSQHSMESLLRAVAHLSKKVMPGNAETSVSLTGSRQHVTVVSTGQLARDLDEAQYTRGSGPCLHAATTGELTEVADTRTESRWMDYMERAVDHGNLSSLSVPLIIDDDVSGALNIYARQAEAFDDDARSAATGFAPYVAVALRNMHDYQAAEGMARDLEVVMEARAMIDQATGILMERHELTADQAHQLLFQVSGRSNTALREVAGQLVDTGELPGFSSALIHAP
jgi:GAF domain-containing protein